MKIKINGTIAEINSGSGYPVSQLLQEKTINPAHVVVEINRNIIAKEVYATTLLKENDTIEIIRFVGGG